MKQDLQEVLIAKDQQEEILRKRERELTALKGALKEEVSSHDTEMDKLKEQHDKELLDLRQSLEKATEVCKCQLFPLQGKILPLSDAFKYSYFLYTRCFQILLFS